MSSPHTKVWKTDLETAAGIEISSSSAKMVGDLNHLIAVDTRGTTILGPISFACQSTDIRWAGLFISPNDFYNMIPSTIITPGPQRLPFPPIHGLVNIARDVSYFQAMLI